MEYYAYFYNGLTDPTSNVVAQVVYAPMVIDGWTFQLDELYSPGFRATLVECPEGTAEWDVYDRNGDQHWTKPDGSTCAGVGQPWIPAPV